MEFSRQEYWSGSPCPSPGDLPDPGIKTRSPALQADFLLSEPPRSPSLVAQIMSSILMSNKMRPKRNKKKTIKVIWISVIRILLKAIPIAWYIDWNFLWSLYQDNDAASEYPFYFYFMGTGHFMIMSLNWLLENLQWNLWPNSRNDIILKRIFFIGQCYAWLHILSQFSFSPFFFSPVF